MASKAQPAAPFANRELNGEVLLEELSELRTAHVHQKSVNECVNALRELQGARASETHARIKQLATQRFSAEPALVLLMNRWGARLKTDVDVPLLIGHFERLAAVIAVMSALRRAADRLPRGGRS